jgi:hypothetical protein
MFKAGVALVAIGAFAPVVQAQESDAWLFSAGLKAWVNTWDTWVTSPLGTAVALGSDRYQIVQQTSSGTEVSVVPSLSVRHGDWFASLSSLARTRYDLTDNATPGSFDVPATRREYDASAGYFFAPGLAVTAGYKELRQSYGPDRFKWRGPIVGFSASGAAGGNWGVYFNAAYGWMRATFPSAQADVEGTTRFRSRYRVAEAGVVYQWPLQGAIVKSVVLSAGYRTQHVTTRNYGLAVTDVNGVARLNAKSDLKDVTQGPVVSLSIGF